MFALESLAIAGETHENSAAVRRACDFLVSKQMEDGGWGETYMVSSPLPKPHPVFGLCNILDTDPLFKSCVTMQYAQHEKSQVVQTAWAVLALIYGEYPDKEVIKKACGLLMKRQQADGRWEQEDTEGIFNKNCAIDYPGQSQLPFYRSWTMDHGCGADWSSVQIHLLYLGIGQGRQISQADVDGAIATTIPCMM